MSDAGKLMALAAYGSKGDTTTDPIILREVDRLLGHTVDVSTYEAQCRTTEELANSFLLNVGVESQILKDFALIYQRALFDRFHDFAKGNLERGLPLVIGGGCGLNCDWNTKWRESGLFESVFVPPCANDSGIAIGVAAELQHRLTGDAKLRWDVFAGPDFMLDGPAPFEFVAEPYSPERLAAFLAEGDRVVAWVQGRCEIGPRALCHRSLLAAPFRRETLDRLNRIKKREGYRPIAPVCTEEAVSRYFDWTGPSPYMLYFQRVKDPRLKAVTHVDGTARVQTVGPAAGRIHGLLEAFERKAGVPVLCNTSLNFPGRGFINRMSDLSEYSLAAGLDAFVLEDTLYINRSVRP